MPDQKRPYRIIISGGGTGGHIYPAIAIAKAIEGLYPSSEVLFVGAKNRMEMEKVPAAGYNIKGIWISGIQRKLTMKNILRNLLFPLKVLVSIIQSFFIIRSFKPDVAVGVGGYASWALLFTASLNKIPTLIQEQNYYAGIANKQLSKKAEKICVAYPGMEKVFPKEKIVFTGNPVRKDIMDAEDRREQALKHFGLSADKKVLMVMGGSLGARTINESLKANLEAIENADVQLLWQTGKLYYSDIKEAAEDKKDVHVLEFIYEMELAYAAADVVISRAGALSISELCLVGKPVVLVPSPNVAEDHQTKNAISLVKQDAARMVKDTEAREKLVSEALALLKDTEGQEKLSQNILKLGKPDAAKDIATQVVELAQNYRNGS